MKKWLIRLSVFAGVLIILWLTIQATGILKLYTIGSGSMEPALSAKSRVFISNLKKPDRYDIIAFHRTVTEKDGIGKPGETFTFLYRLVGFGGEVVELRNGYVFINGRPIDDSSHLIQLYSVNKKEAIAISAFLDLDEENIQLLNDSMAVLHLNGNDYNTTKKKFQLCPIQQPETQ